LPHTREKVQHYLDKYTFISISVLSDNQRYSTCDQRGWKSTVFFHASKSRKISGFFLSIFGKFRNLFFTTFNFEVKCEAQDANQSTNLFGSRNNIFAFCCTFMFPLIIIFYLLQGEIPDNNKLLITINTACHHGFWTNWE
jgi:hypothetical protein